MDKLASQELDNSLTDSGYELDQHNGYYHRPDGRGGLEKRWVDGNWSQSTENNMRWERHENGDRYNTTD